ncbi:MAG TPA: hypothetical protein VFJ85_09325 [Acidimicrobiales bacterium]|nr:hypothetical protein [Acidimicrobiales bacterium]
MPFPTVRATICVLLLAAPAACRDSADTTAATTTSSVPASSTTSSSVPKELTSASRVRLDGIGPVVMGMTLDQATAAVGRKVAVDPNSLIERDGTDTCGFADVEGGSRDLTFMVLRDTPDAPWRIARLDVDDDGTIATGGGAHVGSTEDEVRRIYGDKLRVERHAYSGDEGGHYLIVDTDGDGGTRLLFETDGHKVLTYRSGRQDAVDAIEGCA